MSIGWPVSGRGAKFRQEGLNEESPIGFRLIRRSGRRTISFQLVKVRLGRCASAQNQDEQELANTPTDTPTGGDSEEHRETSGSRNTPTYGKTWRKHKVQRRTLDQVVGVRIPAPQPESTSEVA